MEQIFVFILNVSQVRKMNSLCNFRIAYNLWQIVVQITSKRTGTECKSIINTWIHIGNFQKILFACYNTWKSEYIPSRIVRVNCHFNFVFFTGRNNSIQEIFIVLTQFVCINVFVFLKQIHNLIAAVRLPARHYKAATCLFNAVKHLARIDTVNNG